MTSSFNGSFDMIVAHRFGFTWRAHHFRNVNSTMKEWHESITSSCTMYASANKRLIRLQTKHFETRSSGKKHFVRFSVFNYVTISLENEV